MGNFMILAASGGSDAATKLSTIVTADMLKGVLAEITGLLPVVISFIAIRKGISFLQSVMRGA